MQHVIGPSHSPPEPFQAAMAAFSKPGMALMLSAMDHLHGLLWHLQYFPCHSPSS